MIANRNAVMVLPAGINKATGLEYALRELGLSRHELVGVGDAVNDHSFLARCECAVAVANAAPSIKPIATLAGIVMQSRISWRRRRNMSIAAWSCPPGRRGR